ncbi:MAG: hypothetical protein MJ252_28345 [archaeon]|nr:hypothetical protein [archaeon]
MGCCGVTVYPRNPEIDNAKDRNGLMQALKNVIKNNDTEVADIDSHLKKKTPLKTESLSGCDDATLGKRVKYLGDLNESYQSLIKCINGCADTLPLDQAKDLLQKCIGNYYVAYDDTNGYKKDEDAFKQFANGYPAARK